MDKLPSLWGDDGITNIPSSKPLIKQKAKKLSAQQRNTRVTELMQVYFDRASNNNFLPLDTALEEDLKTLFSTHVWGFREVIITIVMARLLDPEYRASEDFYKCKPRSIYEQPIRSILLEKEIPHRQSGVLNIAKAAQKINEQWAAGKDQKNVADAVVRLVKKIEQMPQEEVENFAIHVHAYFLREQKASSLLKVEVQPEADPDFLYKICKQLIMEVPDAGNTPQRIAGYLLQAYHEVLETGIIVSGHEDSANTTNRTSKKVGDIVEEGFDNDGTKVTHNIYEVTVKKFDEQRIRDAFSSVSEFDRESGTETKEIIILCRQQDIHPSIIATTNASGYFGKLEYNSLTFYYQDIYEWVLSQLLRMPPAARIDFYTKLDAYIQRANTSPKVRVHWKHLHE
ncbi:hypothetical protein KDA_36150 [Dictyobacter alpinus]|uniref:Uncharacterized protein n=1 Tax=Dictyobacter alpinus TaxID=2014873 RepID=A0A402B9S1_9CHLR|nr:hypothetical protein [Dictyobacter alpinus]GCE28131.1 hypothetical protein KDA_36150 [Dictyobacter alpinus]